MKKRLESLLKDYQEMPVNPRKAAQDQVLVGLAICEKLDQIAAKLDALAVPATEPKPKAKKKAGKTSKKAS